MMSGNDGFDQSYSEKDLDTMYFVVTWITQCNEH